MPLKLTIGMSRKVGEPNFGSRGATVGLEMEVDSGIVDQPREFHTRIARLFRLAKASVDRELESRPAPDLPHTNGHGTNGVDPIRLATANQIRAIYTIAAERKIDLTTELRTRFDVVRLADLTLLQASELISAFRRAGDVVIQP